LGQAGKIEGRDITSRYMDQGSLFFSITPVAKAQPDGTTDLTFIINKGRQAQWGTITVTGNQKTPKADILRLVPLHSSDLFNRAKLMESQRTSATCGKFTPTKIGLNPQHVFRASEVTDLVNIAFVVAEQ